MDERAEALEELYRRRYGTFRDVLSAVTGDPETGREAVQEAFAQALRGRRSFRGEGTLEAWLWKIALRAATRRTGPERRWRSSLAPEPSANGAAPYAQPADRDPVLVDALRALPERQRLVVFLRYYADLSYAQIAGVCEISEGTVAATLAQARANLLSTLLTKEHNP